MDKKISLLMLPEDREPSLFNHVPWKWVFALLLITVFPVSCGIVRDSKREAYREVIAQSAERFELAPDLLVRVAEAESSLKPDAVSSKGAVGLMQVMPDTATEMAASLKMRNFDLKDPKDNALIGAGYLKTLLRRYRNDRYLALAAYHAGPGVVDNWIIAGKGLPGPEVVDQFGSPATRHYVNAILNRGEARTRVAERPTEPDPEPESTPLFDDGRLAHTVLKRETLSGIANRSGVSLEQILKLNGLKKRDVIHIGQSLLLRPAFSALPSSREVDIIVHKKKRTLELRIGDERIREYRVALGWDPIEDKIKEGDGRTPVGDFYVCQRIDGKYGPSLGLSYPNLEDARRGLDNEMISEKDYEKIEDRIKAGKRPPWDTPLGGAICIHGRGSQKDWTAGCIALDDEDVNELFALAPMGSVVSIQP
ncbi:MAG: transglycosylase SLT domain-containing protein [Verrucomicrobiota bacterium]